MRTESQLIADYNTFETDFALSFETSGSYLYINVESDSNNYGISSTGFTNWSATPSYVFFVDRYWERYEVSSLGSAISTLYYDVEMFDDR